MAGLEYSRANKFLASVGVGLVGASVTLPVAYLRIPVEGVAEGQSNEAALEMANNRLELLSFFYSYVWLIFGVLFISGVILTGLGLWGWMRVESSEDKVAREINRQRFDEIRQGSKAEIEQEEALDDQLKEEALNEAVRDDAIHEGGLDNGAPGRRSSSGDSPAPPPSLDELRMLERQVEERLREQLFESYGSVYEVISDAAVKEGGNNRILLDFLLRPLKGTEWTPFAIDLATGPATPHTLNVRLQRLSSAVLGFEKGRVYTSKRGRPPHASAAVVQFYIQPTALEPSRIDRLRQTVRSANSALKEPVGVILTTREGFEAMSSTDLRFAIQAALTNPEELVLR